MSAELQMGSDAESSSEEPKRTHAYGILYATTMDIAQADADLKSLCYEGEQKPRMWC